MSKYQVLDDEMIMYEGTEAQVEKYVRDIISGENKSAYTGRLRIAKYVDSNQDIKNISEVRNNYIDDDRLCHIDCWFTDDDNEEGRTVAVVDLDSGKVIFFDNTLRMDDKVKASIDEVLKDIMPYITADKTKTKLFIAFGEMASSHLSSGDVLSEDEIDDMGSLMEYEFNNRKEENTFLLGASHSNGWDDYCIVEKTEDGKYKALEA